MTPTVDPINELHLLPKGYPVRQRGSCIPAAFLILQKLPDATAVKGLVGPSDRGGCWDEHAWVVRGDQIIDPTIRQFSWWRAGMDVFRFPVGEEMPAEWFVPLARGEYASAAFDVCSKRFDRIVALPMPFFPCPYKRYVRVRRRCIAQMRHWNDVQSECLAKLRRGWYL